MLEEEDGTGQLLIVSGGGGGGGRLKHRTNKRPRHWSSSLPSPASSSSSRSGSTTTQQEEDEEADVAKCLILLAQGPAVAVEPQPPIVMPAPETPRSTSRMYAGVSSSYECKTCNKCFPSFQALGGHRTSHSNDRKKQQPRRPEQEAAAAAVTTTLSLRTAATGRPVAHECSACGTTFASGQALGGHMRRHRPLTMSAAAPESVVTADDSSNSNGRRLLLLQERSAGGNHHVNLELDLNLLPAPSTEQEVTSPAKRMHHHLN
ncbi:zinc finger protein ZAT5-like [Panicum virgatum]|uniref:C2H2-type domain-containing protein n=1 Tax=Panicum virgatum TaxID=38727 RepID=A0A8T0TQY9_PANVG|nr:zinc finger protein ZAT5-like [Panicum virgatum]KAG2614471.1 hypothetical protein PVAP13_4KG365601 [Panicum virgatum]